MGRRTGFAGFLELSRVPEPGEELSQRQLEDVILNRQESSGVLDRNDWTDESFAFTTRTGTRALILFIGFSRDGGLPAGMLEFSGFRVEEEVIGGLPGFVSREYETPRSSLVKTRGNLYKVADWDSPLELSRHLEGIVIPGAGALQFSLPEGRWRHLSFSYGPLKEFSGEKKGKLIFRVLADGQEIYRDSFDFARGQGREGWRRAEILLEQSPKELVFETDTPGCPEPVAGIWGLPVLWNKLSRPPRQTLLICVDSLRRDLVGAYGAVDSVTTFIDQLASQGTRFDSYFSAGNSTSYALTALFTGRYAGRVGLHRRTVYDPLSDDYRAYFRQNVDTFPARLRDRGVATFAAMDNPFFLPYATGVHVGFEEIANYGGVQQNYFASTGHLLDFVRAYRDRDFFAFLHYDPDHLLGYDARRDDPTGSDLKRRYRNEIGRIDAEVGRLLKRFQELGLDDSLTIILLSDHGENLDPRWSGHGNFLTDDQIRVPLIIRQPGENGGKVQSAPVSTVDLAGWILSRYGLEQPPGWDGMPEAVAGRSSGERWLVSEGVYQHRLALVGNDFRYILTAEGEEYFLTPPGQAPMAVDRRRSILVRAEEFLADTRAGGYLRLPAGRQFRLDLRGLKVWPVGIGTRVHAWRDGQGTHLLLPPADTRYLLVFPLDEMSLPAVMSLSGPGGEIPYGVPADFLPVHSGPMRWQTAKDLEPLTWRGHPRKDAGAGDIPLFWVSPGAGVGGMATDTRQLDSNIRSLLQRWGYIR
ncbi:MAG: hypothetical protein D6751_08535 [Deltaproteobacteria bacterium]|nr:MAG: hypothetical protein D6751_08535 [Deltaproteobacteria bacterium]